MNLPAYTERLMEVDSLTKWMSKQSPDNRKMFKYSVVLGRASRGSLASVLYDPYTKLTATQKMNYMLGIAKGMQAMYKVNLSHRDLKTNNILVDEENALITDFDSAQFLGKGKDVRVHGTTGYYSDLENKVFDKDIGKEMTEQADVYAWAMIAIEIITNLEPINLDRQESKGVYNWNIWTSVTKTTDPEKPFTYEYAKLGTDNYLEVSLKKHKQDWYNEDDFNRLVALLIKCANPSDPKQRGTFEEIVNKLQQLVTANMVFTAFR